MRGLISTSLFLCSSLLQAAPVDYAAAEARVKKLVGEMVAANTTNPPGNEARIVKLVADRFKKEGIPYEITEFAPGRQNIVARLKGSGEKKPLMWLAHIDVVGTADQIWSIPDPHKVVEKEGYLYGRGVSDNLSNAAGAVETILLLKASGEKLNRDFIVALTGAEETSGEGITYILEKKPEQVNAELTINEGAGLLMSSEGKMKMATVQVGEKIYEDFNLVAKGATGHSSVPQSDNAIYKLSRALARLDKHRFPIRLSPLLRTYLKERSAFEKEPLAGAMKKLAAATGKLPADALKIVEADLGVSTLIRTTCVATMINGGTKENALAAIANANVNCRILPDENPEDIQKTLVRVIDESDIEVKPKEGSKATPASPMNEELFGALKKVLHARYPGLPIVPVISKGATDSRYLRQKGMASYGFGTFAMTEADARLAHGVDERMPLSSYRPGIEMMHQLVLELAK